jgi:predicted transcriptional regulator
MKDRRYRNKEEIIASILQTADEPYGMSKTRVMFNCFVSYAQISDYLHHLLRNKLLQYDPVSNLYKTTERGN